MKARFAVNIACPAECGFVMRVSGDLKTMQCTNPNCKLFGKKFTVPTTEIELVEDAVSDMPNGA